MPTKFSKSSNINNMATETTTTYICDHCGERHVDEQIPPTWRGLLIKDGLVTMWRWRGQGCRLSDYRPESVLLACSKECAYALLESGLIEDVGAL